MTGKNKENEEKCKIYQELAKLLKTQTEESLKDSERKENRKII